MSVIVTGGAGFIGSCVVRMLNNDGCTDIIIVDNIASTGKWKNLSDKKYSSYYNKSVFLDILDELDGVESIIHMGACSSTTERDFDYLWINNVEYSKKLWEYAAKKQIPFIYASSAATYGDGSMGFDDKQNIDNLRPLNGYGYSKQAFDQWANRSTADSKPPQHVGLKFFNVYGPNEYFKGSMASMVFHGFKQIRESGRVCLFKSYNPKYANGGQLRDFVYVKDVCEVIRWLLSHREVSGLFNVGTGRPRTFHDLASATFAAMGLEEKIEYIDMPEELKERYQYYTCANMDKLKSAGYDIDFVSLEQGVQDYVLSHLERGYTCY